MKILKNINAIANDNSIGQIVVSGKTDSIESLDLDLRKKILNL